jgi:hypothetical protein
MQYLRGKLREFAAVDNKKNTPYCMQSIPQQPPLRLLSDKFLHDGELVVTTSFESAGVMENIVFMICEDVLILDVMLAALQPGPSRPAIINQNNRDQPRL